MEKKGLLQDSFISRILFKLFGITAIISACISLRYIFSGADGILFLMDTDELIGFLSHQKSNFWHNFVAQQQPIYHKNELLLLAHIIGMSIALIVGVFQFIPFIRKYNVRFHKVLGYLYAVCALIGLFLGAYLSVVLPMVGGLTAIIPNVIGGFLGVVFILIALNALWQKKYITHGEWMLRSYAVLSTLLTLYFLIAFLPFFAFRQHLDMNLHIYYVCRLIWSWLKLSYAKNRYFLTSPDWNIKLP